jgi:hypothetical protein
MHNAQCTTNKRAQWSGVKECWLNAQVLPVPSSWNPLTSTNWSSSILEFDRAASLSRMQLFNCSIKANRCRFSASASMRALLSAASNARQAFSASFRAFWAITAAPSACCARANAAFR